MNLFDTIPYSQLPFHSQLVKDYLSGNAKLTEFYQNPPTLAGLVEASGNRKFAADSRTVLYEALQNQYKGLEISNTVSENITQLKAPNTFTITTGHQLCAYGGPAYFIYKIASAINLSKQLNSANTGAHYVPVFWMASEDHDFEEISEVFFYGKSWKWESDFENAGKVPVGNITPLPIAAWAKAMKEYFREDINANILLDIFETAYSQEPTMAAATRKILNTLFGKHGLVIIDGNDRELKHLFIPHLSKEIKEISAHHWVQETTEKLVSKGYSGQIQAREVNLFYIDSEGLRNRIDKVENGFQLLLNKSIFTPEKLQAEIENSAERFSPNVVLRPLYQECILPNIAYIGGPAEVAYWLQLKGVFDYHQIDFPVLLVRNSFLLLNAVLAEKAMGLGISWVEFFAKNADELVANYLKLNHSEELNFDEEKHMLETLFEKFQTRAASIDKQISVQMAVDQKAMTEGFQKIQSKFNKSVKQKSDLEVKSIQRIKSTLFPQSHFQERYISYFDGYAINPMAIDELIEVANPLDYALKLLKN